MLFSEYQTQQGPFPDSNSRDTQSIQLQVYQNGQNVDSSDFQTFSAYYPAIMFNTAKGKNLTFYNRFHARMLKETAHCFFLPHHVAVVVLIGLQRCCKSVMYNGSD